MLIATACGSDPSTDEQASATTGSTEATEPTDGTSSSVPTDPTDASGTTGAPTSPDPVKVSFGAQSCAGDLCWIVPRPQGNSLRAASSTGDHSFAVGDHATFLRFDGVHWQGAALPPVELATRPEPVFPSLRGVVALAPDDVWIAGDYGTVLRFDGDAVLAVGPEADPETTHYVAIWATGPEDIWLADSQGRISRFDGASWTTSLDADAAIAGLWGTAADDMWALAESDGDEPEQSLLHFDGKAWSKELLAPDVVGPYGIGRVVAISGRERGQPWLAFEWLVLRRSAGGTFDNVYEPLEWSASVTAATDFVVTDAGEAWLATPTEVLELTGASNPFAPEDLPIVDLGAAPDGSPWLFGPGGLVRSADSAREIRPTVSADPGTLGEPAPPITQCAPDRDEFTCAERRGDAVSIVRYRRSDASATVVAGTFPIYPVVQRVRSDGAGNVAVVWPHQVVVIDAEGEQRTLAESVDDPILDIEDAALLNDGTVLATQACTLHRAGPDDDQFEVVPFSGGPGPEGLSRCWLHPHPEGVVWVTGYEFPGDTDEDMQLVVWASDGTWQRTLAVPDYFELFPPVTVTASGVPFVAVLPPDDSPLARVYRGEGSTFVEVPLAPTAIPMPVFAARGEDVYFAWDDALSPVHGAWLARWSGGDVSRTALPAHAVTDLDTDEDGVWLQTSRAILFTAAK